MINVNKHVKTRKLHFEITEIVIIKNWMRELICVFFNLTIIIILFYKSCKVTKR